MKVPISWLKDYVEFNDSANGLADKLTFSGVEVEGIITEEESEIVLDLEITPNRPDCLSMIGIAREIAVLYGSKLKRPDAITQPTCNLPAYEVSVEVQDSDLCPRYTARILDKVEVKPSPDWMQKRLILAGVRPD